MKILHTAASLYTENNKTYFSKIPYMLLFVINTEREAFVEN